MVQLCAKYRLVSTLKDKRICFSQGEWSAVQLPLDCVFALRKWDTVMTHSNKIMSSCICLYHVSSFHSTGGVLGMDPGPRRVYSRQGQPWWNPSPWRCRTGTGTCCVLNTTSVRQPACVVVCSGNAWFNRRHSSLIVHAWSRRLSSEEGGEIYFIWLRNCCCCFIGCCCCYRYPPPPPFSVPFTPSLPLPPPPSPLLPLPQHTHTHTHTHTPRRLLSPPSSNEV